MRHLLPCLAAFFCATAPVSSAVAQITVDRELVMLNPAVANERVVSLTLGNAGSSRAQVVVALEDWDVDAEGTSHWRKTGAVAGSCGRRVSISPATLQLAPGEKRVLRISINTNAQFDSECWSAAVVHSTIASTRKFDSAQTTRSSVPLYVTPSGLSADGELSNMYVKGDSLEVIYRNTGKIRTNIVGEIQVRLQGDSVVTTVPLDSATVLVGATRRFRVPMPKLPRGKYVLVALMDFGGEQLTAVQAALEMR
ncbi:MAG: hypothetical protein ABJB74_11590 [Gemmatimonas sp.]